MYAHFDKAHEVERLLEGKNPSKVGEWSDMYVPVVSELSRLYTNSKCGTPSSL